MAESFVLRVGLKCYLLIVIDIVFLNFYCMPFFEFPPKKPVPADFIVESKVLFVTFLTRGHFIFQVATYPLVN